MDNDDVSGWKNEQRCSPSWVERVNDGWLDGLSPAEGQKEQKNICEQASVVNSVNCTFISFFLRLELKKKERERKKNLHTGPPARPSRPLSIDGERLSIMTQEKMLLGWFQCRALLDVRRKDRLVPASTFYKPGSAWSSCVRPMQPKTISNDHEMDASRSRATCACALCF